MRLIERAHTRELDGYVENHHVYPKCLVGPNNYKVALTAEEHYVAHQLLTKIFPSHTGLAYAAFAMGNEGHRTYGWLRKRYADKLKGNTYGHKLRGRKRPEHSAVMSGEGNPCHGKFGSNHPAHDSTIYHFYHPEHGDVYSTKYDFRMKYNLAHQHVGQLCRGKQKICKGWTIK